MNAAELPSPGDVLAGKYRVQSVLGAGGMGIVLLVEHIELAQAMAVKLMMPGASHDAVAVARFVREARAAAGLQSEHVVRIFDVGTAEDGAPYIVMELLRGEDLAKVLARAGRLSITAAVDYVLQACHAIAEAHASGIVHRDLKPSNLFLSQRSDGTGFIKVLDFGISKAMTDEGHDTVPANLTATSAVMGSPLYMSPEQVRNAKQVDGRADIWSLGVILHELLTGAPAFRADTLPGICAAIIADEPPSLRSTCHDAPAELEAVVGRCLEKNARYRFQSVRDLMLALRPFASTAVQSGVVSSPGSLTMPETGLSGRASFLPPVSASATLESVPAPSRGAPQVPSGAPVATSHRGDTVPSSPSAPAVWPRRALIAGAALAFAFLLLLLVNARQPRGDNAPTPSASAATISPAPDARARTTPSTPDARASFALTLESVPAGADVLEGDRVLGATPLTLSVDNGVVRNEPRRFSLKRDRFESYAIVQGPSQDNVRVLAQLRPMPTEATTATERTIAGGASIGRAPRNPSVVAPSASAPSLATTSSARPLNDDIRPRR